MTDGDMRAQRVRVEEFGFTDRSDYLIDYTYPGQTPSFGREPVRDVVEVWTCPRCAALTAEPVAHIDWHDKVGA